MARRSLLIAALVCAGATPGCSALGLFDRAPAVLCRVEADCRIAALMQDTCVAYACDATVGLCLGHLTDLDHDGTGPIGCASSAYATEDTATDCDDHDPTAHVGVLELCGGTDNDCDGVIDEDCVTPHIALGEDHTCYLGGPVLLCWGSNEHGQIGIGDAGPVGAHPQRVAIDDGVAITAGRWTTCVTRADGRVFCWGDASVGQLALPTTPSRHVLPTEVPALEGATSVTLGDGYGCALFGDEVRCWGGNLFHVFGTDTPDMSTTPIAVPGVRATHVDAGGGAACAVLLDGTVSCWGTGFPAQAGETSCAMGLSGRPCPIPGVHDIVALETGGTHGCGLGQDGSIVCWGNNAMGALGADLSVVGGVFAPSMPVDAVSVTAGGQHTCAVGPLASMWCWGSNETLQAAGSLATSIPQPTHVFDGLGSFATVVAGFAHTCAIRPSGSVVCWGGNIAGQLGAGTPTATTPTFVEPLTTWEADGQP